MPVKVRISLLFTVAVFIILMIVGGVVYYISDRSRLNVVKTRLTLRANNIASFFKQSEVFNSQLIQRMDTSTAASARDKEVQVYDRYNKKVYSYSDRRTDTLILDTVFLNQVREQENIFFVRGGKEAIAMYNKQSDIVIISATYDEPGKRHLTQLRITLWLSIIGGGIISLAGGYFFAGRLLRPIRQIADEVNEISAKNLTQRIRTGRTKDEWYYLSSTLNDLLNRLQGTLEMHRRFISNASHELSTPLASISSRLDISLHQHKLADEYRNVMTAVHKDAVQLNKLTQTLLEFAKTSGDESGLEIQPVRVDEIVLRLPAELAKIKSNYVVLLEFENLPADEDRLLTFGNEELLFTAVKNIVVNACKYSADHKALIKLQASDDEISIAVVDNGPGIAGNELEDIFQPFYRGNSVGTIPGFGLGLSLTRRIIKLHKGRIHVESDIKNGTTFLIVLPSALRQEVIAEH